MFHKLKIFCLTLGIAGCAFLVGIAATCPHCNRANPQDAPLCQSCFSPLKSSPNALSGAGVAAGEARAKKVEIISKKGQSVTLEDHVVPGAVTIFDFYADWCGPCKALEPELVRLTRDNPNVYLRKINIVKWGSPVARQYNIRSIPSVWIADPSGRMTQSRISSLTQIKQAVKQAQSS